VEEIRAMSEDAKLGKQYRADLTAQVLAEGVRAKGEHFDKAMWERLTSVMTIDDLKKQRDSFTDEAKVRLGEPGRQTNGADPNTPAPQRAEGDDVQKQVEAFLDRTK
jgi:hypothetical protein